MEPHYKHVLDSFQTTHLDLFKVPRAGGRVCFPPLPSLIRSPAPLQYVCSAAGAAVQANVGT
jgi:hypothetical protein